MVGIDFLGSLISSLQCNPFLYLVTESLHSSPTRSSDDPCE